MALVYGWTRVIIGYEQLPGGYGMICISRNGQIPAGAVRTKAFHGYSRIGVFIFKITNCSQWTRKICVAIYIYDFKIRSFYTK